MTKWAELYNASGRRIMLEDCGNGFATPTDRTEPGEPPRSAQPAFFDARVVAVDCNAPEGYDLVVNATPLGLADDDAAPVDVARLHARRQLLFQKPTVVQTFIFHDLVPVSNTLCSGGGWVVINAKHPATSFERKGKSLHGCPRAEFGS